MLILFGILVIIASVVLGLIVLVQNPKGGGLSGSLGGFSNQLMGVKQTTDVLEKGTWLFAIIVGVLCLVSSMFMGGGSSSGSNPVREVPTNQQAPAQTPASQPNTPAQQTPAKP